MWPVFLSQVAKAWWVDPTGEFFKMWGLNRVKSD
jgi:hypothetical protein